MPTVAITEPITITFHLYSVLGRERIFHNLDTFRCGSYGFKPGSHGRTLPRETCAGAPYPPRSSMP
jgi:hypothetical protein